MYPTGMSKFIGFRAVHPSGAHPVPVFPSAFRVRCAVSISADPFFEYIKRCCGRHGEEERKPKGTASASHPFSAPPSAGRHFY